MPQHRLEGDRVLVVEDEYLIADEVRTWLEDEGAEVLGPAFDLKQAFELLSTEGLISAAVLDVKLHDEAIYPLADRLIERAVPIVFTTGYAQSFVPVLYSHIPVLQKPYLMDHLMQALLKATMARSVSQRTPPRPQESTKAWR